LRLLIAYYYPAKYQTKERWREIREPTSLVGNVASKKQKLQHHQPSNVPSLHCSSNVLFGDHKPLENIEFYQEPLLLFYKVS